MLRAWAWRVWLNGGDGLLPWLATRTQNAWEKAEPLTVFYSGAKFGQTEPFGSLRLKAYRRGQQDIEYVNLLAQARGWSRDALTRAIQDALDLSANVEEASEEDAGTMRFQQVRDRDLETLRRRVAAALVAQ
jgi:ParB-like chromosome segregation protein Spo0J